MSSDSPGSDGPPDLDIGRILETLDRHGVSYLIVGWIAATIHGARRQTTDFDCLPERTEQNLRRLAAALTELGARLRVAGMTDEESKALGVVIDEVVLDRAQQTTWRTDAGDLDVLIEVAHRDGKAAYAELESRSVSLRLDDIDIRLISLDDLIASKEAAGATRTTKHSPNFATFEATTDGHGYRTDHAARSTRCDCDDAEENGASGDVPRSAFGAPPAAVHPFGVTAAGGSREHIADSVAWPAQVQAVRRGD